MLPPRFSILTALVALLAVAAVPRLDAFWAPHSDSDFTSLGNQFQYNSDGTSIDSQPWVQQMRNLKDILRVQAFRPKPTPTPTPTPKPTPTPTPDPSASPITFTITSPASFSNTSTPTYISSSESFDRHPLHPLRNYFSDVAGIYGAHGYSNLQSILHGAGRIIENLNNPKDATRFREARKLVRKLENAVAISTDFQVFDRYTFFEAYDGSAPHVWDDYRGIALSFAQNLQQAAKNASHRHALDRGLPYTLVAPTLIIAYAGSSQGGKETFTVTKMDGYGRVSVSTLVAPSFVSSETYGNWGGSGTTTLGFSSSWNTSSVSMIGFITVGSDTPTPTPSPTP